ncbi:MAG TPA: hypothetical protein VMA77_01030 [Solirubrobacteraceae bacterium]|nr:hypothetical protein [Solirubrobacteraceae bacterium]
MPDVQRVVFRRLTIAAVIVGTTVAATALAAPNATAAPGARTATPCLVRAVLFNGAVTQRLALHGKVSCAQARRTYQRYLRDADSGACGSGRICQISQPGGWRCSALSAVESQMAHGLEAGCTRRGASFGVYPVRGKASDAV